MWRQKIQCERVHAEDDKGWFDTGDSMAINNSPKISSRNADAELDETAFRSNKKKTKLYLARIKGTIDTKFGCNMKLQRNKEKTKSKSVLANIQSRPKVDLKSEEEEPST